jgi:hypothetical protein
MTAMTNDEIAAELARLRDLDANRYEGDWKMRRQIGECDVHYYEVYGHGGRTVARFEEWGATEEQLRANAEYLRSAPAMMRLLNAMDARLKAVERDAARYLVTRASFAKPQCTLTVFHGAIDATAFDRAADILIAALKESHE